ncbi:MAG: ComEC/Rec2 family competence protein [Solirubrobacterales bacterium]
MSEARRIAVDLAALTDEKGDLLTVLAWGDPVTVVAEEEKRLKVEVQDYETQTDGSILAKPGFGYLKRRLGSGAGAREVALPADQVEVLKLDFVDVQQGDGAVLETPAGKLVTLDGGDTQLFARYLAARYPGTSPEAPKRIDALVVSHGDADHFAGLTEIHASETNSNPRKRLFVHPDRVYHNGLVKRPSKVKDSEAFGATAKVGERTVITELESDLTEVADEKMNSFFLAWKRALADWKQDGPIEFRHLLKGDDDAFDFLADEDLEVQVLGPIPVLDGAVEGLPFLGSPGKDLGIGAPVPDDSFKGLDASHTINGNSIVLRIGFKNWRIVFAGDLNTQAEQTLVADHEADLLDLRAEVFKVPHHGSAEYSEAFLAAVEPLVSVVSSGDESARKEYIHPRATLMSALGRHSRDAAGVVFVTELVAFFDVVGWVRPDAATGVEGKPPEPDERDFFAFRRTAYGIVRIRTDGERLLVFTNSGQDRLKEAYAFTASAPGEVTPVEVLKA